MLYERSRGHLARAKGSLRARRQAGGRQSARLFSIQWGGGGHRLQSCWLGGQLMDGLCRVPKTATLYVKTGAVRSGDGSARSPSSIKIAVEILRHGEIILMFPSAPCCKTHRDSALQRHALEVVDPEVES